MTYGLREVTVRRGDATVLRDVTVAVEPGAVVAVVGGDGAGKTTLLRTLVGEIPPDAGTVDAPPANRLGYLPATTGSWLNLSVLENLDFVGGIYGLTGDALASRRTDLLARAALLDVGDRLAANLSGGMRRKLGFCLAMLHDPALLVLDEPSTGVDPVSRVDLWRLVSEAAAGGAAVLMSTTYLDEAERAAALLVLDRGRVLASGSLDDVLGAVTGAVAVTTRPVRPAWSWRRGRRYREWWPDRRDVPADAEVVTADLEDAVVVLSLQRRAAEAPR